MQALESRGLTSCAFSSIDSVCALRKHRFNTELFHLIRTELCLPKLIISGLTLNTLECDWI